MSAGAAEQLNRPLRILHLADSHIGADLPRRGGGSYRRGADFVESFRRVLARATELGVDVVIHAGDLFDTADPTEGAIAAACEPIWETARSGIPVIIIPGNHERSVLPHLLLLNHANIHVLREPETVLIAARGGRIAVAGFPCIRRGSAAGFSPAVEATGWRGVAADLRVLAVHQTFEGARCGPANFRFRAGADVVPREAVPDGFDYVAAGHVHRYQVLRRGGGARKGDVQEGLGPPIVYAGSPDRIAFAEIGEPKGCVLVECTDRRVQPRFIEHQVRPMAVASVDVSGASGEALADRVIARAAELPRSAAALMRLTGQATKRTLAGLHLTARVRAARPDLLVSLSFGAVEWIAERSLFQQPDRNMGSAFEVLDAPPAEVARVAASEVGTIAARCGTYCLYDAVGRLLYVGKALNLRGRLRSHLRGCSAAGQFGDWSQQIAGIEVRPAASELEALLVEAELIRRLVPPYNRQMRLWKRYCYLRRSKRRFGQLEICPEPRGGVVFGPLHSRARAERAIEALGAWFGLAQCGPEDGGAAASAGGPERLCRRYFGGVCAGVCAGRIEAGEYERRLAQRDALLAGEETDDVRRIAAEHQALSTGHEGPRERELLLHFLAHLCRTAALLRRARGLSERVLVLPGDDGMQTAAIVTSRGLHLGVFRGERAAAEIAEWRAAKVGRTRRNAPALPKPVADMLCTAARAVARQPDSYICETAPGSGAG